ncbi:MAG: undecaprenyl-diphosphatase [Candidatus Magasanikbacteria bacterium CG_4_9_14_0_2_um_filter_42_11]|uniref:Undecaprenyl-diphosphatase n=1 Tax=Candidatus Magasanikbacteria bacterium CG_4_9_14_0_2_um_filter_42_11 TaxID=1974643 RepID=A0A2M8F8X9_9BACT|nr:MAG: undecaprenyl-diphosphatase [Candidatus Magasanikbacteria bacterium CG_4_9_14_0_2_um_filter_42_11]
MSLLHALTLGLIQGLTEFLPVSSSGHLIFVPHIFGWVDQGLTFDVIVHLGTLVAVVVYFREKIFRVLRAFFVRETTDELKTVAKQERVFGWMIALSILPALAVGFVMSEVLQIEIRSTLVVAWGLIGWGILLGVADRYNRRQHNATSVITWKKALLIGCAQALALIPGTSRSGITMTTGLFAKLSKKDAAEFSFLMSVPVIAVAGAVKVLELINVGGDAVAVLPLVIGFFASAISGYIAIWGLLKIIQKWSFMPFVVYRIMIGILILFFLV